MFNEYGIAEDDVRKGIVFIGHPAKPEPDTKRLEFANFSNLPWVKLCLIWEKEKFTRISTGQAFPPKDIRYVFPRFPKGRFLPSFPSIEYFYRRKAYTPQELQERDDKENAYHSYYLQIFQEEPLYDMQTDKEIFRLLTIPSFERPSLIRLEKEGDQYSLTWKICEMGVPCGVEKIVAQDSRKISKFLWNIFHAKLGRVNIWNPRVKNLYLDGVSYLFEGRTQGVYLMKYEHCPEDKPFVALCMFFRRLVGA